MVLKNKKRFIYRNLSKDVVLKNTNFYYTLVLNKSVKNIFFSLHDFHGNLVFKFSSGLLNIKNKIYRFDSTNISKITRAIFKFFSKFCYGHLRLKFKNCQLPLISAVLSSVGSFKRFIFIIDLLFLKPHNGMRLKKARRL